MDQQSTVAGVFDPELDPAWSVGDDVLTDDGRAFQITRVERLRTIVRYYGIPAGR
jgi:hypothetical protein